MDLLIRHRVFEEMDDTEFFDLCQQNRDLRFERNPDGNIIVMSPASSVSGDLNSEIDYQLRKWNKEHQLGKCFDSSAGFTLPDNSVRSPDASFIFMDRWKALSTEQRKGFAHICPDFVIELKSESDAFAALAQKMQEYLVNGCCMGWLIDPDKEQVFIFLPGKNVSMIEGFHQSIGENSILPGFSLDLRELKTEP
jgi:Uma2 family endonuclease